MRHLLGRLEASVISPRSNGPIVAVIAVGATSAAIAIGSARPYAGSWNDGSRLATVESLVDRGTMAIDDSIFLDPSLAPAGAPLPYTPSDNLLLTHGTQDRLLIGGHYYSDKPPSLSIFLAAVYKAAQSVSRLTVRDRPDVFCVLLTVFSSGIGYVSGAVATYLLAQTILRSVLKGLLLTGSFTLATVALVYTRHVNGHLPLLGVFSALLLACHQLAARPQSAPAPTRVLWVGTLAGVGYALDAGVGPLLVAATLALLAFRRRRLADCFLFAAGALPWIALHHAVNYSVGGTLGPANRVVAYLAWPGSPFTVETATGFWSHDSVTAFAVYTLELLFGRKGFLLHNLPLLMAAVAVIPLLRQKPRVAEWPEIMFASTLTGAIWLLYAAASTNSSGVCVSIRWFVPLLAPGFYVLALHLRERPGDWRGFLALSAWGTAMGWSLWSHGPWNGRMAPLFWVWVGGALATWAVIERHQRRHRLITRPV